MYSIEVQTKLEHSSNLYFVILELEMSPVTMRDNSRQRLSLLDRGFNDK